MHCSTERPRRGRPLLFLIGSALLAGVALPGIASAAEAAAATSAKPVSSCVACHTDLARLQEEAKGIPIPTGSALQAGKG